MASRKRVSGWTILAAVLMVFGGVMAVLEGIVAIAHGHVFVATRDYVFSFSVVGWGWIHLVLGIVIFFAGLALFGGAVWARVVGVILAALSALGNFLWIPHAPFWALVLLGLDITIIWALCAGDRRRVT
ncbi:DUF7144 family membrane protein [Streptomyces gilvosporeus]|uniref:DUF7144 domain-containing protein n=1 Tax=Streptomyces gilvosporeus TaxID=553510 RepID=A0A1V0TMV9_9ACTN|nr:hypothetical protein [Streptomyces gilvosporeus]ARF54279.1 hypothetical protein B1H19_08790 [Streptomyces gilvosporeus]